MPFAIRLIELLEQAPEVILGDSGAGILDLRPHLRMVLDPDPDLAAPRREADGVGHQVRDDLTYSLGVHPQPGGALRRLESQGDGALPGQRLQGADHLFEPLHEVALGSPQPKRPGLEPGVIPQIVHERLQAVQDSHLMVPSRATYRFSMCFTGTFAE